MVWKKQIEEQIPHVCLLEDDLELNSNFLPFILSRLPILEDERVNILRGADWGECYITSLESAKRLIKLLERNGITGNIDEQLWSSGEIVVNGSRGGGMTGMHNEESWINGHYQHVGYQNDIFKLHVRTNEGDIRHTEPLPENISETFFMGTPYDIKAFQIEKIKEKTTENKNFLSFGLNSMSLYFLKQLKDDQTLETYEYGRTLRIADIKNNLGIPDSKFKLNDIAIDKDGNIDYKLMDQLNKSYGSYMEEYHPKIILNFYSKIDYKKYDVFVVNGFARAPLIYLILLNANKGSKIFLSNGNRDWYDWVLEGRDVEDLDSTDFKLITV
jgi:hypothetical protein